jgi:aspartyl-tRNA(Asn)/glutamyl-tRNA(Gln) amidotransferase subunit C
MSRISPEEVEYTADLARLELSPEERDAMTRDLDRILDYVAALQQLDTDGIEPTSHPIPVPTPLRADTSVEPIDPALAVSNAPQVEGTAFVVPKVIDPEDEG